MRTSKIQNDRQGAPKWPTGSEKGSISRFRGAQLSLNKFFDPSSFYEKSRRREKKNKKLMSFLVTTNVVASWPPEHRQTGTLHARAKTACILLNYPLVNGTLVKGTTLSLAKVENKTYLSQAKA